jgi:NADPH-dependent curcumin reductase
MTDQRQVWRLRARPVGDIKDSDLEYLTEPMPAMEDGQALVAVNYLSLDPTNRIWMSDMDQYMPPVALDDVMRGGVAGTVIASRNPDLTEGMTVTGLGGWASHVVVDPNMVSPLPMIPGVPMATLFGSLGGTALTAYFGLLDLCDPKPGETLLVSGAAGAVGSAVGQIGKIKGCHVVGIAGGAEKCRYVIDELGFDACIDYRNEDVAARLDALCPGGIDINFENVGGEIMDAVMHRMNDYGRMALCGMISTYNDTAPVIGPKAWPLILMRRLKVQGFIVTDFAPRFGEGAMQLAQWWMEGKLKARVDLRHGLENAVTTVRDLYNGGNFGKLLLEVAAPESLSEVY